MHMKGKGESHREILTCVQLPNWMRGSNLSARHSLCKEGSKSSWAWTKAPAAARGSRLQVQEQKRDLPRLSCCSSFLIVDQSILSRAMPMVALSWCTREVSIFQMPPHPSLLTPTSLLASGPIWGLFVPWARGSLSAPCAPASTTWGSRSFKENRRGVVQPSPVPCPEFWRWPVHDCG